MSYQQSVFLLIARLGGSKEKAVVEPTLCRFMGGLEGGVFLGQLLYWSDKGNGGSFYKSYKEWEDEIFLSKYQVKRAADKCVEMGFLETKVRKANGNPTVHYRILGDKFIDLIVRFVEMESQKFNFPKSNFGKTESEIFDDQKSKISLSLTEITTENTQEITTESESAAAMPPTHPPPHTLVTPQEIEFMPDEEPTPAGERTSRRAPTEISSGVEGAKRMRLESPHIDPRHFVNGFVPPGTGETAVEVYYERFSINLDEHRLTKPHEDDLVRNCKDLALLREVITAYHQSPHRVRNIKLILDWYREPHRFRETHHGSSNGRAATNNEQSPTAAFSKREWDEYRKTQNGDIPF